MHAKAKRNQPGLSLAKFDIKLPGIIATSVKFLNYRKWPFCQHLLWECVNHWVNHSIRSNICVTLMSGWSVVSWVKLTADTYGKISDDFVRFLWMMATAAPTNFCLSQPSPNSGPSLSQDTFTKLRCPIFSRFLVQIVAASAARFVPDSTNDGIPTFVVWDRGRKPLTNSAPEDDLPLYHIPCT